MDVDQWQPSKSEGMENDLELQASEDDVEADLEKIKKFHRLLKNGCACNHFQENKSWLKSLIDKLFFQFDDQLKAEQKEFKENNCFRPSRIRERNLLTNSLIDRLCQFYVAETMYGKTCSGLMNLFQVICASHEKISKIMIYCMQSPEKYSSFTAAKCLASYILAYGMIPETSKRALLFCKSLLRYMMRPESRFKQMSQCLSYFEHLYIGSLRLSKTKPERVDLIIDNYCCYTKAKAPCINGIDPRVICTAYDKHLKKLTRYAVSLIDTGDVCSCILRILIMLVDGDENDEARDKMCEESQRLLYMVTTPGVKVLTSQRAASVVNLVLHHKFHGFAKNLVSKDRLFLAKKVLLLTTSGNWKKKLDNDVACDFSGTSIDCNLNESGIKMSALSSSLIMMILSSLAVVASFELSPVDNLYGLLRAFSFGLREVKKRIMELESGTKRLNIACGTSVLFFFEDQDELLVDALLFSSQIYILFHTFRLTSCDENHLNFLDPHALFHQFLMCIHYDHQVMLDFLLSNETSFLFYIVRYLKLIRENPSDFIKSHRQIVLCERKGGITKALRESALQLPTKPAEGECCPQCKKSVNYFIVGEACARCFSQGYYFTGTFYLNFAVDYPGCRGLDVPDSPDYCNGCVHHLARRLLKDCPGDPSCSKQSRRKPFRESHNAGQPETDKYPENQNSLRTFYSAIVALTQLKMAIDRSVARGLFPFNVQPLLTLLIAVLGRIETDGVVSKKK